MKQTCARIALFLIAVFFWLPFWIVVLVGFSIANAYAALIRAAGPNYGR